jgi:hypothetical protein
LDYYLADRSAFEGLDLRANRRARRCFVESTTMNERHETMIHRRDVLRAMTTGVAVAAASAVSPGPVAAAAETETVRKKRKSRYQANSAEVRNFYRVNSYPVK